jgi:uncharacterized membrane protein YfcA
VRYISFLRWWVFASLMLGVFVSAKRFGIYQELIEGDQTFISIGILVLFVACSLWCGFKTFVISKCSRLIDPSNDARFKQAKSHIETGWFASEICMTMGMIGTFIGFIIAMSGLADVDFNDVASVQKMISVMASGVAVSLYTTLTGLICSVLLKLQYFNLEHFCNKVDDEEKQV